MAIQEMQAIKFNLRRQNEQAEALIQVIERVEQIESNVNEKYEKVTEVVEEVRNRVYIEYEDQKELQSIVAKKANEVANEKYGDMPDHGAEFRELVGYARRHVWKKLKNYFNVTRYTSIRHVDRDEAKEYARSISLGDSFLMEYDKWRYQRAKKKQREMELVRNP